MSLETSIAVLIDQVSLLLNQPQQLASTADAKIAALSAAYQANQNAMSTTYYVHQSSGSDANQGIETSPLQTIGKALALTPAGGVCSVRLLSDYHISGDNINVDARILNISGANGIQRKLTHEAHLTTISGTTYKSVRSISLGERSALGLATVDWTFPLDPSAPVGTGYAPDIGLIRGSTTSRTAKTVHLSIRSSTITRPGASNFPAIYSGALINLEVLSVIYADQPMLGRWLSDVTNSAGTAASGINRLVTTLTNV